MIKNNRVWLKVPDSDIIETVIDMKKKILTCLALLFLTLPAFSYDRDEMININVYEKINPAIVSIDTQIKYGLSCGTGCVVSDDGVILTSSHVIEDGKDITVTIYNGKTYKAEVIKKVGRNNDLALLKIKTDKPMVERIRDTIEYVFDKANDYERIKEKLIGETFEYAPEFNYIINGLLMRYENCPDLIRFLRENTKLIISTFNKSGTRNLRILKHSLTNFKKIFDMVNNYYPNTNHRVLQTMLIFTIAISFEIKAGKITKDKFVNINDNEEYKAILVSSRVFMDNRQFYIKEFDNNYYYNFKSEYRFFKFIEIYVRTRIFDMKTFKNNMEIIINTIDTNKLPGYKRLLTEEYWKISDDEFGGIIESIIENIKKGELTLLETVKMFAYFSYFSKKGLIQYDIKTIKTIFFNGMNIASLNSSYCENPEEELKQLSIDESSPEMDEILKHFYDINIQLKDKMYREKAEEIFKCIPMKMETFYDRFEKECMNVPIFKYYDVYQMFQRISCASNEDIVSIREILRKRVDKHPKEIEPEMKNIKQLKQIVDDYIKGKDIGIKIVMLEEFSKDLGYVLDKYKTGIFAKKEESDIV